MFFLSWQTYKDYIIFFFKSDLFILIYFLIEYDLIKLSEKKIKCKNKEFCFLRALKIESKCHGSLKANEQFISFARPSINEAKKKNF